MGKNNIFSSYEYVYNDGRRSNDLGYHNIAKKRTRNCDTSDIIKYETGANEGNNNKIRWDYTTDKSYGIGIVKEKMPMENGLQKSTKK